MGAKETFGKQLRKIRHEKGLTLMQISKVLGYENAGYVSDAERGKFIPHPDKLAKWAKALGMTQEEMDSLLADAKLEDMGLTDPGFTLMFKEVPNMTSAEKESIIKSYKRVMKAREAKRKTK